jgi:pimeloyl-ACP methyl ester carboxylesterase
MSPAPEKPAILTAPDGATIAYRSTPGKGPGVMFLTGFRSDMTGGKALAVEALCRAQGRAFVRFDYTGHGLSSGAFVDGTIGRWAQDATLVLDRATAGPQVLVGSSMGGWIALLLARARRERIAGLVGIAAAPDFTEDLVHDVLDAEAKARLARDGQIVMPSAYDPEPCVITRRLIEEGRDHLLLRAPIPIDVSVRLIHGMEDHDVPWQTALAIADRIASRDVEITLIKGGRHRLSEPEDLDRLRAILESLLRRIESTHRP